MNANTHLHTKALSNSPHSPALVLQICLASRSQTTLPSLAPSPVVQRARQHFNLTHTLRGHQRSQALWSGDLLTNNVLIIVLCMRKSGLFRARHGSFFNKIQSNDLWHLVPLTGLELLLSSVIILKHLVLDLKHTRIYESLLKWNERENNTNNLTVTTLLLIAQQTWWVNYELMCCS